MKFSMHNWMRPEPIETTLERLHRYGYDGIEISGEPQRYDTKEVRGLLDKYKLECWGGVTLMFEGRDLVRPDRVHGHLARPGDGEGPGDGDGAVESSSRRPSTHLRLVVLPAGLPSLCSANSKEGTAPLV